MATPSGRSAALSTGPSRTLLQQLLEEINESSPTRVRTESASHSPASTRSLSSSQTHSPSVWVRGSSFAQDARDKLRAADEARRRRLTPMTVDGAPDLRTPMVHFDTLELQAQDAARNEYGKGSPSTLHQTPDPVKHPHEYMQYMMKGSPLSTTVGLSPAAQGHDNTSFHLQAPSFGNDIARPLSPLMFSDVDFDDSLSSLRTGSTASPTEAPISAATMYTAEEPRTPGDEGTVHPSKRIHFADNSTPEESPKKKRTMTLPDIHSEAYSEMAIDTPHRFIGVGGDNRCVLRGENFTERAPTPRMSVDLTTSDALPELSSFRPTIADPQRRAMPTRKLARAFTSPVRSPSPTTSDMPAWMRPMHLIDTGGKSIYMNAHDDGPIHHALCLHCFRTGGSFRKVHRCGYEACGRTEVLDSHYWEDDAWPEESSDDST